MLALWNTDYLLRSIQRIASVTEEYIESTVIEDDDEFVRVGALSHRFEPADVLDLALLLSCSEVVVFDNHALVLEDRIIAAYHACLCSKEEFELGLVLGVLTTILRRVFNRFIHSSCRLHLLLDILREFVLVQEGREVNAGLHHF